MAATIRPATPRDAAALGRLGAMLMHTHYAFDSQRFLPPGHDAEEGYAWFLGRMMKNEDAHVFVAEDEEGIAGYVYVEIEPLSWKELRGPAGFIHDIAVAEGARRSGVAAQLLEAALQWLREREVPRAMLWTATPNESAQRLFRRFGFRDTMLEMTLEL